MTRASSSLALSLMLLLLQELAPLSRAFVAVLHDEFDEVDTLQEDATEAIVHPRERVIYLVQLLVHWPPMLSSLQ